MEKEKVSIIIPLFNKEKQIAKTLKSVLEQSYKNIEIVVIDDGSSDNSGSIVKSIKDDRIVYVKKTNGGVSSARNLGIDRADGKWILFLDADDLLYKDAVKTLINGAELYPNADVICGTYDILKNGIPSCHFISKIEGYVKNNFKSYFYGNFYLRAGSAIIKRGKAEKYYYPENIKRYEDECVALEYLRYLSFACVNIPVMAYVADTIALSVGDDINKDFIGHLDFRNKSFWERCILGRLLNAAHNSYKCRYWLFKKYGVYNIYVYLSKILLKFNS